MYPESTPDVARQVDATALAEIIQTLVNYRSGRSRDAAWLHAQINAAGLDAQESNALEALRVRLHFGEALLSASPLSAWF